MKSIAFVIVAALGTLCAAQQLPATSPPVKPPLVSADISKLPKHMQGLDLYLLMGQSNMKGRGFMPDEPGNDPRIVMMHMKDDQWYLARHPLHLTGDAKTFTGHDNAGVGTGLVFAETLLAAGPEKMLLALPKSLPKTACTDARDVKTHTGDKVRFDTAAQNEIGKRFAAKMLEMT
jgi:Carbohydrate esterase, sialic acid-specific acetylesterase